MQTNIFTGRNGRRNRLLAALALILAFVWWLNPGHINERVSAAFTAAQYPEARGFTQQELEDFHATSVALATPAPTAQPTAAAQAIVKLSSDPITGTINLKLDASYTLAEISGWPDGSFVENQANPLDETIRSTGSKWSDAHNARLLYLEKTYIVRNGSVPTWASVAQWMTATGGTMIKGDLEKDARQIEEEQIPMMDGTNVTSVAGIQLKPVHIEATWPAVISTDKPYYLKTDGRAYQPDPKNAGTVVTNGGTINQLTFWGDAYNWGRTLWDDNRSIGPDGNPHKALQATAMPSDTSMTNGCLSLAQLNSAPYSNGIDTGAQGARNGLLYDGETLAGAVVKVNGQQIETLKGLGWTIQGSNAGVKSAWSPANCRPLTDGR